MDYTANIVLTVSSTNKGISRPLGPVLVLVVGLCSSSFSYLLSPR